MRIEGSSLEQTLIPFTQVCFVSNLVKIGPVVQEKIFKFFQCIFAVSWKKVGSFIWTNLNPRHPRRHCVKFGWNWSSGSREDFWISSVYFRYCLIISSLNRAGPFINPLHHCVKLGWNWPSGSGEEDFLKILHFRYFVMISPWKRAGPFIWTNLNIFTQGCFVSSLV